MTAESRIMSKKFFGNDFSIFLITMYGLGTFERNFGNKIAISGSNIKNLMKNGKKDLYRINKLFQKILLPKNYTK